MGGDGSWYLDTSSTPGYIHTLHELTAISISFPDPCRHQQILGVSPTYTRCSKVLLHANQASNRIFPCSHGKSSWASSTHIASSGSNTVSWISSLCPGGFGSLGASSSSGFNLEKIMTTTGPLLQTKRDLFLAFLKRADSVTVDSGDQFRQWSINERTGHIWIGVEEEKEYSLILTESGIANGTYTPDGKFVCLDQEGKQVVIRFFTLECLTNIPTSVNDKDGVNYH
jgi:hypothetical protein